MPHESMACTKAQRVLAALLRIGWNVKRQTGSHQTLERSGWPDMVFAFHDNEEICSFNSPECLTAACTRRKARRRVMPESLSLPQAAGCNRE